MRTLLAVLTFFFFLPAFGSAVEKDSQEWEPARNFGGTDYLGVSVSPGGTYLVVRNQAEYQSAGAHNRPNFFAHVLDRKTGEKVWVFEGPSTVRFSPSEKQLVVITASNPKGETDTVTCYDTASKQVLARWNVYQPEGVCMVRDWQPVDKEVEGSLSSNASPTPLVSVYGRFVEKGDGPDPRNWKEPILFFGEGITPLSHKPLRQEIKTQVPNFFGTTPDGRVLVVATGTGFVSKFDLASLEMSDFPKVKGVQVGRNGVWSYAVSNDCLAAGCHDGIVRLLDLKSGRVVKELDARPTPLTRSRDMVNGVAFSPDGKLLVATGHGRTHLFRVEEKGKKIEPFTTLDKGGSAVAFAPDLEGRPYVMPTLYIAGGDVTEWAPKEERAVSTAKSDSTSGGSEE